jgi:hypothetical protein
VEKGKTNNAGYGCEQVNAIWVLDCSSKVTNRCCKGVREKHDKGAKGKKGLIPL